MYVCMYVRTYIVQYITMIIPPATQAGINDKAATEAALSILLAIGEYYQNQVASYMCFMSILMCPLLRLL